MADEPRRLNPQFRWLGPYGHKAYNFDVYRAEGSDSVYFINPEEPTPREAEYNGGLDIQLDQVKMTELRDLFTELLDNWGKIKGNPPDQD
jgi:hypothetical protein